jgi:hypothetical protein
MPRFRAAAITALAFSLCLAAAAQAATTRNPAQSPNAPSSDQTTSVGEPFLPRDKPKTKTYTYDLSCEISGYFNNGVPALKMMNTGTETIPAGAVIEITYPDGTKKKHTVNSDIVPGAALTIWGPLGATPEDFPCTATATSTGPYIEPGTTNAPSGNPNLPPKLACEFKIVDGKLVVTFKNVGGSPLPAQQFLHAGPENTGYGVSHYLQQDIAPGESIHLIYDGVDPALYMGTDCTAKIMK